MLSHLFMIANLGSIPTPYILHNPKNVSITKFTYFYQNKKTPSFHRYFLTYNTYPATMSTAGNEETLYPYIDTAKMHCLNEHEDGAAQNIIKPYHERLDNSTYLESNVDCELLLFLPFTCSCRVTHIALRGPPGDAAPATVHLYTNRDDIDFDAVQGGQKAVQTLKLAPTAPSSMEGEDVVWYPLQAAKFNNVSVLALYMEHNQYTARMANHEDEDDDDDDDEVLTRVYYAGVKGKASRMKREAVNTVYEAKPSIADHKIGDEVHMSHQPGV
eukprot:gb/GECH01003932.1/.p1 GENE.gb/GECH01003932.1/~~gb/GECH01003932.1/.p1  ORF type:complete len:272 (+),score=27.39 gb/GECH01003932.1/:1-816(+)